MSTSNHSTLKVKMRLALLAVLFMLTCAAPVAAQISYGARGGGNFSSISFDDEVPSSSRGGPLAGVFATVPLGGWLAIQPEVIYTVKGASIDVFDVESDFIVDYLEVPVLARFPVGRAMYVAAGPAMAFRLRARSRTSFGGSTEEVDVKDGTESFDLGVVGAVGAHFGRWVLDVRYTHGFSDIDADTTDAVKIRNRAFSVSAGLRF